MKSSARPGWFHRTWTAFGIVLKRGLLGKSSHEYMKQFTRNDNYSENGAKQPAQRPSEPEYEPVHGWTKRQTKDYLARNPAYRASYEAELEKHAPA